MSVLRRLRGWASESVQDRVLANPLLANVRSQIDRGFAGTFRQPEPLVGMAPGADNNGFASMMATLLRQNLDERPEKKPAFARMRGRIALVLEDIDTSVTLVFSGGRLVIHDGIVGIPNATVVAPWEWITKMSLVELEPRFGLPDPRGEVAMEVAEAQKNGVIKIHGFYPNLPLMLRFTRVMSVVA